MRRCLVGVLGLRSCCGSALYYVSAFAAFAFVAVLVFMAGEHYRALPLLRKPHELQALLNARSGVWKTIAYLSDSSSVGAAVTVNTFDTVFGNGLFPDTVEKRRPFDELVNAGGPVDMRLFASDSFGACSVTVAADPVFLTVQAQGACRGAVHSVTVQLGASAHFTPDTVLFVDGPCPSGGSVAGSCVGGVSQSADMQERFAMRPNDLKTLLSSIEANLAFSGDSGEKAPPLTIQAQGDLENLPEIVEGPLFIDGSVHDIRWTGAKTQYVLGDLQFTGEAIVENVRFVVLGAVKIFDKTELRTVSILTRSELHIGDRARFSGTAVAAAKIVIYGQAEVYDRSVLVVTGAVAAKPSSDKPQDPFSLFVSEQCSIDGVLIALGNPGGIKTDERSRISGVMWSEGQTCHRGELHGALKAKALVDCDQSTAAPGQPQQNAPAQEKGKPAQAAPILVENILRGKIRPLDDIAAYYLPFFMGQYAIAEWKER